MKWAKKKDDIEDIDWWMARTWSIFINIIQETRKIGRSNFWEIFNLFQRIVCHVKADDPLFNLYVLVFQIWPQGSPSIYVKKKNSNAICEIERLTCLRCNHHKVGCVWIWQIIPIWLFNDWAWSKKHDHIMKTWNFLLFEIWNFFFCKCSGRNPASDPEFTTSCITFVQVEVDAKFLANSKCSWYTAQKYFSFWHQSFLVIFGYLNMSF